MDSGILFIIETDAGAAGWAMDSTARFTSPAKARGFAIRLATNIGRAVRVSAAYDYIGSFVVQPQAAR